MIKIFKNEKINRIHETVIITGKMLKLVWQIDPPLMTGTTLISIIPGIIPFVNAYIYKLIIDWVIEAVQTGQYEISQLLILISYRMLAYFIQSVAFGSQEFLERLLWTKVPIYINQIIFKKISALDLQFFEDSNFKDLLEKVRDGYGSRPQRMVGNALYTLQGLVQVIIALVAIIQLNWFLVILIFLIVIPEFIIQTNQSKASWGIWQINTPLRKKFNMLSYIIQSDRWIKEIKIFRLANRFLSEIRQVQQKFYNENKSILTQTFWQSTIFNILSTFVFIGFELYVISQALTKKLTVGDIGFYTGVVNNFQNGLSGMFRTIAHIFDDSLYIKSIFDLLETEPVIKMVDQPVIVNYQKPPLIQFIDVDFAYSGSKKKILDGFSLTINPGEKVAFVGENGAGKSTIIKLLARFYDVDSGEILINGINLKNLDLESWYEVLGVLFQDFNKYDYPVSENIGFGKVDREHSLKEIVEAAISAGAHPMISKFEKGYEQMLGRTFEGGLELSGGQWQKIALSRAFLKNAPILVLDEPTASIDAKGESEIFNRVEKLSKNKTVIIISHRFSTVRNADKIYVINKGKITESGSHAELMKQKGQYASLFNLQAKGYQ